MSGQGEIWLDGEGLPLRLSVDLEFPDPQTGERVAAVIQTDFSGFESQPKQLPSAITRCPAQRQP